MNTESRRLRLPTTFESARLWGSAQQSSQHGLAVQRFWDRGPNTANMPACTRSSAPAERIYTSSVPKQQIKFKPRRQRVSSRHSLAGSKLSRQQTLTQIDFVQLPIDDDLNLDAYEEQEKTRRRKRRKTMGDEPASSSKHYTQTLTQLDFVSSTAEDNLQQDEAAGIPQRHLRRSRKGQEQINTSSPGHIDNSTGLGSMGPPATPLKPRQFEIPSSQSPATPISIRSRKDERSPLKDVTSSSNNIPRPPSVSPSPTPLNPKLVIQDTFSPEEAESQRLSSISSSSEARTPRRTAIIKGFRFALSDTSSPDSAARSSPLRSRSLTKIEIEDSDADSDDEPDTCYDDMGMETQAQANELVTSSGISKTSEDLDLPLSTEPVAASRCSAGRPDLADQPRIHKPPTSNNSSVDQSVEQASPCHPPVSQLGESQRLCTQAFENMAPRSTQSDIILPFHPQHVQNIVSGVKNHEFRPRVFPPGVKRVWMYETRPASSLRYMFSIGSAKVPGEVSDMSGMGNQQFNEGIGVNKFAYEIVGLYELSDPVSLATAKARNWLVRAPTSMVPVPPAVLDRLMANLKRSIFGTVVQTQSQLFSTDSQDAAAQLQSTMIQFSDPVLPIPAMSSPIGSSDTKFDEALDLLSTQHDSYRNHDSNAFPRPSQASTVDLTQVEMEGSHRAESVQIGKDQSGHESHEEEDVDEDIEPEHEGGMTLIPDSPALPPRDSVSSDPPTTLRLQFPPSSQLLTRSQMLPSSLMNDSIPPPPFFVDDTDAEDE